MEIISDLIFRANQVYYFYNGLETSLNNWEDFKNEKGGSLPIKESKLIKDCIITGELEDSVKKGKPVVKFKTKTVIIDSVEFLRPKNEGSQIKVFSPNELATIKKKAEQEKQKELQSGKKERVQTSVNYGIGLAPYNFIPLNSELKLSTNSASDFSTYSNLSGYINLKITAKTPIFVQGEKFEFFKINKVPHIPGSSLRGMLRTIVEIISKSKFENFYDRDIYNRKTGIDANASLRSIGFLRFNNTEKRFEISPATARAETLSDKSTEFEYKLDVVGNEIYVKIYSGEMKKMQNVKNFKIKYEANSRMVQIVPQKVIKSFLSDDTKVVKNDKAHLKISDLIDLSKSGSKFDKKITELKNSKQVLNNISFVGVPVWYETSNGEVTTFGHCKNYRVPSNFSIGAHVPNNLKNSEVIDITEAIFGTNLKGRITSGKVQFEDAVLKNSADYIETFLQILASPKPKSGGFYLEPNGNSAGSWNKAEDKIRGYKLYWHKETSDFEVKETPKSEKDQNWKKRYFSDNQLSSVNLRDFKEEEEIVYESLNPEQKEAAQNKIKAGKPQFTIAKALNKDSVFECKIRFENLSEMELGALLTAIDLEIGCCHKIGMGKPIGLGSIKVDSTLKLINRHKRYSKIFNDAPSDEGYYDWHLSEKLVNDKEPYKTVFAKEVYNSSSIWNDPRMSDLRTILRFDDKMVKSDSWIENRRYMKFGETPKKILPKIENV
jgi:CRISPR-associated protein (TIGR03986 family)